VLIKEQIDDPKLIANKMCECYTTVANNINSSDSFFAVDRKYNKAERELNEI